MRWADETQLRRGGSSSWLALHIDGPEVVEWWCGVAGLCNIASDCKLG